MNEKRNAPYAIGLPLDLARDRSRSLLCAFDDLLRRRDALGVALAVGEPERIGRLEVGVPLVEVAAVEEEVSPPGGGELVVLAAERAHLEVRVSCSVGSVSSQPSHLRKTPLPKLLFSLAS